MTGVIDVRAKLGKKLAVGATDALGVSFRHRIFLPAGHDTKQVKRHRELSWRSGTAEMFDLLAAVANWTIVGYSGVEDVYDQVYGPGHYAIERAAIEAIGANRCGMCAYVKWSFGYVRRRRNCTRWQASQV